MLNVRSTYKVLAHRALGFDYGEEWVEWAIEMIGNGYDSEHLFILAGLIPPFNMSEIDQYVEHTLKELGIGVPEGGEAADGYGYYLMKEALESDSDYSKVLYELNELYFHSDYQISLLPFNLLYFANEDLKTQDEQHYWDGANKNNIKQVISEQFLKWIKEFELLHYRSA